MCGLNKIVALNGLPTHAIVEDSLKHAAWNEDRGGYDEIDDVGLGAGIKYYTLPTPFIQRKINEGFFKTTDNATVNVQLTDRGYGIGRYFLSKDATDANNAKKIIADVARAQGLKILGWRNLSDSVNQTVLSEKANERMPAMWDAILIPDTDNQTEIFDLERAMLTTELHLENYTAENNNIDLSIISHSSHYWTFKGLIPAPQMGDYFPELQDPAFTATAADIHIRDPTAKDADAKKAHPFGKIAHNGEFNSADSNFAQLTAQHHENKRQGITSVLPKAGISDSMLMSLDLLDSLVTKKMNIYTALVQLMPPLTSTDYSDEINAMLKYQRLVRNPYNGPATVITEHNGYHIMATDTLSLRPAFYLIMEDKDRNRTFYSGSENLAPIPAGGKLIESGQLEAGGMIMITPTSEVLHTVDILNRISAQFNNQYGMTNYFQTQLQQHLLTLPQPDNIPEQQPINTAELRRKAFAAFMHREDEERILKMAAAGAETKGALGNDTNPLHEEDNHFSNSMHRKHAQVTAPALSPMLDPDSFHLIMYAGDNPISCPEWKRFGLPAALSTRELYAITQQSTINVYRLDTTFSLTQANNVDEAIAQLLSKLEILTQDSTKGGFLILSDETLSPDNIALPDLRVISEVRNYLACIGRLRDFPIISDSRQIATPHQAALQITFGAASVYPRTALEIINHHYQGDADEKNKQQEGCHHFIAGLNKEIAGDMGEIGVTDLGNYRFGNYASPLGINTKDDPHLSQLFGNSPLKGATREDLSNYTLARHEEAYKPNFNSNVLPRSGFLMPNPADDNKESIAHTFSHAVSGAMKHFFAEAGDDRNRLMVHYLLNYLGICEDYLSAEQLQDYTKERGYLDPNSRNADGFFNLEELEGFTPSVDFKKMTDIINKIRAEYPTTLYDRLQINKEKLAAFKEEYNKTASPDTPLQTLASILKCLSSGNMSYGALTKPAWLALLEGVKAGGMLGSAGEGGQPVSLIHTKNPLQIADIDQYAAGHFGVHIRSILRAKRIVVKVSQSAKPGSYAEVPGLKMDEEKAATRGCPEGTHVTSPTYLLSVASIEDLTPLYRLMKSINPAVEVDIKISTPADDISPTIRGASRKGYNFDLGSSSGGTGSAKLGSRNVGFPGIIGLLQTIAALRASGYAELVTVQVSDSFITALDILKIYILADLLNIRIEFGTTGMFTVGCEGDRTCYTDCSTGVAANEERFKGEAINASLYFLSLAADLQNWLCILGVKNLKDLSGHTELLSVIDPEFDQQYDLSSLINNKAPLKKVSPEKIAEIKKNRDTQIRSQTETDLMAVIEAELNKADAEGRPLNFTSDVIILTGKEHGFGAGIAGKFYFYLKDHPEAHITIKTKGIAGQFYGFGTPKGMSLIHRGHVQEKWCESLDGGDVTLIADDNSPNAKQPTLIAGGNLGLYGCNDGETHVVGDAGNNFRPLGKGGSVTIRGKVGDFACKYMTDGTAFLISRQIGRNLGQSIRGGIVFLYDPDGKNTRHLCHEIRVADAYETSAYSDTIRSMLIRHLDKTVTDPAEKSQYLQNFDFTKVKVLIPTALDQKKTLISILKLLSSYHLRKAPISPGVKVWLTQKVLQIIRPRHRGDITEDELTVLNRALDNSSLHPDTLPQEVYAQLKALRPVVSREPPVVDIEQVVAPQTVAKKAIPSAAVVEIKTARKKKHTASSLAEVNPVTERLSSIGALDKKMPPVVQNIFKIVALLKAEAERCKCLAQTCTTTTDKKTGCAEGKDIRTINDTLKKIGPVSANGILTKQQWALLREAAGLQFEKSFSPVTGHICDARCQQSDAGLDGGCTVATHDESVAIQKNEHLLGVIADDDDGLGWMTGRKTKSWTQDEFEALFGTGEQGAKNK